jgi:hypothetical protein
VTCLWVVVRFKLFYFNTLRTLCNRQEMGITHSTRFHLGVT